MLQFDPELHRIFLSNEIKRCTNCHKIGHLSELFRMKNNDNLSQSNEEVVENDYQQHIVLNNDLNLSSSSLNTENNESEMF